MLQPHWLMLGHGHPCRQGNLLLNDESLKALRAPRAVVAYPLQGIVVVAAAARAQAAHGMGLDVMLRMAWMRLLTD